MTHDLIFFFLLKKKKGRGVAKAENNFLTSYLPQDMNLGASQIKFLENSSQGPRGPHG